MMARLVVIARAWVRARLTRMLTLMLTVVVMQWLTVIINWS